MLFLKNRKGTKREMQTYRVRAWYLAGPVAQDQNGWDRGNKTMGTGDRFSTALSSSIPAQRCQQEGALALKSQGHVCVRPDGDKDRETRITRRKRNFRLEWAERQESPGSELPGSGVSTESAWRREGGHSGHQGPPAGRPALALRAHTVSTWTPLERGASRVPPSLS